MERLSRAEIESSVDSFPDLDYKFEHIDWADIMDAEEASNPEQKLEILQQKSYTIHSSFYINQTPVSLSAMPALTSLRLDDNSRGLPPLQLDQSTKKHPNRPVPTSFSGVLNTRSPGLESTPNNTTPSNKNLAIFKVPAPPKLSGRSPIEGLKPLDVKDRKSGSNRPPPSPSSIHEKKRLKISNNSFSKDWDYVDDDFIFTTDSDITPTNYNSFRLPIPHSASVSTLESDTELETSSAYSETSSTSTLTSKRPHRREPLPTVEDPKKLDQRQKQIDYGKNTEGYINYIKLYPKFNRTRNMPRTPDKTIGYSHRRWLGLITKWRKALHKFDMEAAPKYTPPKPMAIQVHLEDANTFPTLPLEPKLEPIPVETENIREEVATPFSYSLVLQNLQEKIDKPPQNVATLLPNNIEHSDVQSSTPNQLFFAPVEEETPIGPRSYSTALKAPKPTGTSTHPVVSPIPGPVKQEERYVERIVEDISSEDISENQENIPPPSKPTYCQVLMAPKPPNPITSPPILTEIPSEPDPLPPEKVPLPEDSESDDSMEVDSPLTDAVPTVETTPVVNLDISQPLTYSQALRSKPFLKQIIHKTAETEGRVEKKNELKECGTVSNESDKQQEVHCKIESCELPSTAEPSPLTYSQVLAGVHSPVNVAPVIDKDIDTESEDASLEAQISKSADTPTTAPPLPISYRHLIPTISIQEQS